MSNNQTKKQDWRDSLFGKIVIIGGALGTTLGITIGSYMLADKIDQKYQREFCKRYGWLKGQSEEVIRTNTNKYIDEHTNFLSGQFLEDSFHDDFYERLGRCD